VEKKSEKAAAEAAPKKGVVTRVRTGTGGNFHRSIRDTEGNILRTMEFPRNIVVEIDAEELKALVNDISAAPGDGGALVEVDEKKMILEQPSKAVAEAKKAAVEAEKKRLEDKAKANKELEAMALKAEATVNAIRGGK
jgi:hypothetical protein